MSLFERNTHNEDSVYETVQTSSDILLALIKQKEPDCDINKKNVSALLGKVNELYPDFLDKHPNFVQNAVSISAVNFTGNKTFPVKIAESAAETLKNMFIDLTNYYVDNIKKDVDRVKEEASWTANYLFSKEFTDDVGKDIRNTADAIHSKAVDLKEFWKDTAENISYNFQEDKKDFGKAVGRFKDNAKMSFKEAIDVVKSIKDDNIAIQMLKNIKDTLREEKNAARASRLFNEKAEKDWSGVRAQAASLKDILRAGKERIVCAVKSYISTANELVSQFERASETFAKEVGMTVKDTAKQAYNAVPKEQKISNVNREYGY